MLSADELYVQEITLAEPLPAESYLCRIPPVRALMAGESIVFSAPITCVVGENGSGKSTLIEALAVALGFNPEGGTKNFNFSTKESHSELGNYLRVLKGWRRPRDGFFLRAESFYNVASNIDDLDEEPGGRAIIESYGGVSLHHLSHGQSFLALAENRFGGHGIYVLDEPEAALSPQGLLRLAAVLSRLVEDDSQVIMATHSPVLMALPGAHILRCDEDGLTPCTYEDTDHWQIMNRFFADPERFLRTVWDDEVPDKASEE